MTYFRLVSKIGPFSPVPYDETLSDAVFENNNKFSVVTAIFPFEIFVIECENKPRDLPLYGIHWEEVKDTVSLSGYNAPVVKSN